MFQALLLKARFPGAALAALALCAGLLLPLSGHTQTAAPTTATPVTELPLVTSRQITGTIPSANDYADNPYGLRALWGQGDLVARTTLLMLVIMSLGSWYVLVSKLLEQRRMGLQARAAQEAFVGVDTVRKGLESLTKDSPFRYVVESSMDALRKHESVADDVDMNTWLTQNIERSVGEVQAGTQTGLSVLATVGATAPFVGLFGTVWGIYNALVKIGASGQASIDRVAGPVGEALIMTAIGLAVAVPAVLGYNWLVRRNRVLMDRVRSFGSDLHTMLLAAVGKSRRQAAEAKKA